MEKQYFPHMHGLRKIDPVCSLSMVVGCRKLQQKGLKATYRFIGSRIFKDESSSVLKEMLGIETVHQ